MGDRMVRDRDWLCFEVEMTTMRTKRLQNTSRLVAHLKLGTLKLSKLRPH